jgi:hypothetical protein
MRPPAPGRDDPRNHGGEGTTRKHSGQEVKLKMPYRTRKDGSVSLVRIERAVSDRETHADRFEEEIRKAMREWRYIPASEIVPPMERRPVEPYARRRERRRLSNSERSR